MLSMYSHAANIDPFVCEASTALNNICHGTFVYKRELNMIPGIGLFMQLGGHTPLARTDRKKAVATLRSLSDKTRNYGTHQIVAPEGTRSKSGQVQALKKGPFHMQRDLGRADVLPIVLTGNFEAWRGLSGIRMCRVRISYLAPHACPEYEDE